MPTVFQHFLLPVGAGLAMFLTGMKIMEHALYAWTGGWMKRMLARLTGTPFLGLLTGTGTTAVLQSSSAVTVVTIGMVNAGVLSFPRTLGIILGTNIGTCLTTELIGLNLSAASLPGLAASIAIWLLSFLPPLGRAKAVTAVIRGLSLAAAGFCGIMLGIRIMQGIVPFLQEKGLLAWFLEHAQRSLLWGIVAGAVLAAVIHSSSAVIAMTMSLAGFGAIPVPLGIAIVLGCNVGTCLTALLAGIGGGRFGLFVAYSHIILNVAGAVLFYPFIGLLHLASAWMTADPAGQIAHAQTLFNVICSLLALPVCYLPAIRRIGGNSSTAATGSGKAKAAGNGQAVSGGGQADPGNGRADAASQNHAGSGHADGAFGAIAANFRQAGTPCFRSGPTGRGGSKFGQAGRIVGKSGQSGPVAGSSVQSGQTASPFGQSGKSGTRPRRNDGASVRPDRSEGCGRKIGHKCTNGQP